MDSGELGKTVPVMDEAKSFKEGTEDFGESALKILRILA